MERIARLRWLLIGGATGVLAALLLTPATGWIVRSHTRYVADPFALPVELTEMGLHDVSLYRRARPATGTRLRDAQRAAAAYPGNYQIQLAAALMEALDAPEGWMPKGVRDMAPDMPAQEMALRALEHRIGPSPALCACILRFALLRPILVGRPETELLSDMKRSAWSSGRRKVSPGRVRAFIETARTGERLDPENAFFPMMLAIGLLAERSDRDAEEALKRAGGKAAWNDYAMGEALGRWQIAEDAHGEPGSLARTAQAAAILFPHYAQVREMYRVMVYRAVLAEEKGRMDEGIALRGALLRVSSVMRSDATSVIGALVAVACGQIAVVRPGGSAPERQAPDSPEASEARARRRSERYAAYLRRAGERAEAGWFEREAAASAEARSIVRRRVAETGWMKGILDASILTAASASQAATIVWMVLCSLAAWIASLTPRVRSGQPMAAAARCGAALGLVLVG
ncbi:MAG: hypothetical protein FJX72_21940, partial [Armatimonadetes bacterium]|nr:hypothetical protein [Armatimonadota bacterium]